MPDTDTMDRASCHLEALQWLEPEAEHLTKMKINIQPMVIQKDDNVFKQEWQSAIKQGEAKLMETMQNHLNRIIDKINAEIRRTTNDTYKKLKTLTLDKTTAKNRLEDILKKASKDRIQKLNWDWKEKERLSGLADESAAKKYSIDIVFFLWNTHNCQQSWPHWRTEVWCGCHYNSAWVPHRWTYKWINGAVQTVPMHATTRRELWWFLVVLRELDRTCQFCSKECSTKNIRDQIIEGICDGDTVEHLLQQQNLTLDAATMICQAQEAAKNQHRKILDYTPGAVLTIKQPPRSQKQSMGAATTQNFFRLWC